MATRIGSAPTAGERIPAGTSAADPASALVGGLRPSLCLGGSSPACRGASAFGRSRRASKSAALPGRLLAMAELCRSSRRCKPSSRRSPRVPRGVLPGSQSAAGRPKAASCWANQAAALHPRERLGRPKRFPPEKAPRSAPGGFLSCQEAADRKPSGTILSRPTEVAAGEARGPGRAPFLRQGAAPFLLLRPFGGVGEERKREEKVGWGEIWVLFQSLLGAPFPLRLTARGGIQWIFSGTRLASFRGGGGSDLSTPPLGCWKDPQHVPGGGSLLPGGGGWKARPDGGGEAVAFPGADPRATCRPDGDICVNPAAPSPSSLPGT